MSHSDNIGSSGDVSTCVLGSQILKLTKSVWLEPESESLSSVGNLTPCDRKESASAASNPPPQGHSCYFPQLDKEKRVKDVF